MRLPVFFLERPVFATVLNAMILVIGFLAYLNLGVREYPNVSLPVLNVQVYYPNASAEIVETEIATKLEEALSGIEGIETVSSSSKYGQAYVELSFKAGTNLSKAQSDIRDRLSMTSLPGDAKDLIIRQQSGDSEPFFYISVESDTRSVVELTHLINLYLKNSLKAIKGVSMLNIMGDQYTMTVALDREKMLIHSIDANAVLDALKRHNVSLPGGRFQEAIPPLPLICAFSLLRILKTSLLPIQKIVRCSWRISRLSLWAAALYRKLYAPVEKTLPLWGLLNPETEIPWIFPMKSTTAWINSKALCRMMSRSELILIKQNLFEARFHRCSILF